MYYICKTFENLKIFTFREIGFNDEAFYIFKESSGHLQAVTYKLKWQ